MKILFIGDIFGKLGIKAVKTFLEPLKRKENINLVIANAENTTNCRGLNESDYLTLKQLGIDYFTMGNHTWRQNDWTKVINYQDIIRPYNIIDDQKQEVGSGSRIFSVTYSSNKQTFTKKIRITNLIGTSLKSNFLTFSNPFICLETILNKQLLVDIDLVDFHTETTSEKNCFLQTFKNKVSAILGTHTHVQTNDARIVNETAYITDVGMTGPSDGVIGAEAESIINMFMGKSEFFKLTEASGNFQFCAVLLEFDDFSNKPISIKNIYLNH